MCLPSRPKKYVYGKADKLVLTGKQTHRCRFMPYRGDWRKARLPLAASEYQRPVFVEKSGGKRTTMPTKASLVSLDSNTTVATALFERKGRLFVRLWEWAGQEDAVSLKYGDAKSSLVACTHALEPTGDLESSFKMRPWGDQDHRANGQGETLRGIRPLQQGANARQSPPGLAAREPL